MVKIKRVGSKGKYEDMIGYSRAYKVGKHIFVSGTGSVDPKRRNAGKEEIYFQTQEALKTIEQALKDLDSSMSDVVRTRVFVRADADWRLVAKAYKKVFDKTRPASTWLASTFLDPNIQVEIEADAILT